MTGRAAKGAIFSRMGAPLLPGAQFFLCRVVADA